MRESASASRSNLCGSSLISEVWSLTALSRLCLVLILSITKILVKKLISSVLRVYLRVKLLELVSEDCFLLLSLGLKLLWLTTSAGCSTGRDSSVGILMKGLPSFLLRI